MDSDTITLVSVAPQLGAPEPFYLTLAPVPVRIAMLAILSCLLGFLGVVAMDFLTPAHGLRQRIGQSAFDTAWLAKCCFILIALVVRGGANNHGAFDGPD